MDDAADGGSKSGPSRRGPAEQPENCPVAGVSWTQASIDNIPYAAMLIVGAAILFRGFGGATGWVPAASYVLYGVLGTLWIILFVCPYCHFYATRRCPCGYGLAAAKLRAKRDGEQFARQFRRHIPVIVPLWFIPPIVAGVALARAPTWTLAGLTLVFVADAFVILPLVSRMYGCKACPQKANCPWMGGCK